MCLTQGKTEDDEVVLNCVEKSYPELLEAFRTGYETVASWPDASAEELETLIIGRGILLANYVAVSEDPEDQAFAPTYLQRMDERIDRFLQGS